MQKTLIGIIVDVSSSMKNNWGDNLSLKESKINAVKRALNKEIQKVSKNRVIKESCLLFCLGIGFRLGLKLTSYSIKDGQEISLEQEETTLIGIICDILTLSQLVPNEYKLNRIKSEIHSYWKKSSNILLDDIKIDLDADIKLKKFIEESLMDSYRLKRYDDINFTWTQNMIGKLIRFLGISTSEEIHRAQVISLSNKYSRSVKQKAEEIFDRFGDRYQDLIENSIKEFAHKEIKLMLERNGLGFSLELIIDNFDKERLIQLSETIYTKMKKDILKEFRDVWTEHRVELYFSKFKFLSNLDIKEVKNKTEDTIKNIGWSKLKPFVEKIVMNIFQEKFEEVSKEMLYTWIVNSTKKETISPIEELNNIFPDRNEDEIYSEQYMFGGTPMLAAISQSALRFNDKKYQDYRKILLIISDGEYPHREATNHAAMLLKQVGVLIICGYVGKKMLIPNFTRKITGKENKGASNLIEISSRLDNSSEVEKLIKKGIIKLNKDDKLCIQLNQPEKLNNLIESLIN